MQIVARGSSKGNKVGCCKCYMIYTDTQDQPIERKRERRVATCQLNMTKHKVYDYQSGFVYVFSNPPPLCLSPNEQNKKSTQRKGSVMHIYYRM